MSNDVTVKVPATAANLGPGFDCLGVAFQLYNTVKAIPAERFRLSISGEGRATLARDNTNLVYRALESLYRAHNVAVPKLEITCDNRIPLARGLGSSSAAIAAGLVAANHMLGRTFSGEELLRYGVAIEEHADNLAPALFGGGQIIVHGGTGFIHEKVTIDASWRFVLFIPDFEVSTRLSRAVLSQTISRRDAVYNLGRVALLTRALITGDAASLRVATQDRLHQPQREGIFPSMRTIFTAALTAGADGVFLSGSGPTVVAITRTYADEISKAMKEAGETAGIGSQVQVVTHSEAGALAGITV